MNIVLKNNGNVYEQIIDHYKKYIDLGIYLPDEKLPSCRILAKELGINPNTVERAYSILESDGYIVAIPKKGFYVANKHFTFDKKVVISQIETFKNQGISYEQLKNILEEVYKGGEQND